MDGARSGEHGELRAHRLAASTNRRSGHGGRDLRIDDGGRAFRSAIHSQAVCQVRVELRPSGGLALGETGSNLAAAVERATDRMRGALAATFARKEAMALQAWLR